MSVISITDGVRATQTLTDELHKAFRAELYLVFDHVLELKGRTSSIACCSGFIHNEALLWHKRALTMACDWAKRFGDEQLMQYLRDMTVWYSDAGLDVLWRKPCSGEFDSRLGVGRSCHTSNDYTEMSDDLCDLRTQWKSVSAPEASTQTNLDDLLNQLGRVSVQDSFRCVIHEMRSFRGMLENMTHYFYPPEVQHDANTKCSR